MSALPPPRRIIATHAPDGSVLTYDDEVPTVAWPGGFAVSVGFVQPSYESDPATAVAEGKDAGVNGIVLPGGINGRWLGTASTERLLGLFANAGVRRRWAAHGDTGTLHQLDRLRRRHARDHAPCSARRLAQGRESGRRDHPGWEHPPVGERLGRAGSCVSLRSLL
jgi:hypothetical protein